MHATTLPGNASLHENYWHFSYLKYEIFFPE